MGYGDLYPIQMHCLNCGTKISGSKTKDNEIRVQCSYCGTVLVLHKVSRRRVHLDVQAPKGQVLLE